MLDVLAAPNLTGNDGRVLDALFDPESSPSQPGAAVDASRPALPQFTADEFRRLREREARIVKRLDQEAPTREAIQSAVDQLDGLVRAWPAYAPAYLNRAQARRLLLRHKDYTPPVDAAIVEGNLSDLSRAISLASPPSPSVPVSEFQAGLLSAAHTHRAYLVHISAKTDDVQSLPEALRGRGVEALEDMASRDFYLGGMYGDERAKQMAVSTNPYAKMCGAIVKEAMKEEVGRSGTSGRLSLGT